MFANPTSMVLRSLWILSLLTSTLVDAAPMPKGLPRRASASVVSFKSRSPLSKRAAGTFNYDAAKSELDKLKGKYTKSPVKGRKRDVAKTMFKPRAGAKPFDVNLHRKRNIIDDIGAALGADGKKDGADALSQVSAIIGLIPGADAALTPGGAAAVSASAAAAAAATATATPAGVAAVPAGGVAASPAVAGANTTAALLATESVLAATSPAAAVAAATVTVTVTDNNLNATAIDMAAAASTVTLNPAATATAALTDSLSLAATATAVLTDSLGLAVTATDSLGLAATATDSLSLAATATDSLGLAATASAAAAAGTGQLELTDVVSGGIDVLYFGTASIGTPPQDTTVDFDTGSSDFIVPVTGCNNCTLPIFATEKSSTFAQSNTNFAITFADQSGASGKVAQDTVTVAGLTSPVQGFGALTSEVGGFNQGPHAALMGLGFPGNAESKTVPFFFNLAQSKALASNVFSFFMARGGAAGSELCLGCTDSAKFTGTISSFKLDPTATGGQQLFWNIPSTGFSIGNGASTGAFSAVIDSGTSLIVIPAANAAALYAQIPGAADATQTVGAGFFTFPCAAQLEAINLGFGTEKFDVNPLDFNLGQVSPGSADCVGGIMGMDVGGGLAIIGDEFMKNWYSVFDLDNQEVGFARAI